MREHGVGDGLGSGVVQAGGQRIIPGPAKIAFSDLAVTTASSASRRSQRVSAAKVAAVAAP